MLTTMIFSLLLTGAVDVNIMVRRRREMGALSQFSDSMRSCAYNMGLSFMDHVTIEDQEALSSSEAEAHLIATIVVNVLDVSYLAPHLWEVFLEFLESREVLL